MGYERSDRRYGRDLSYGYRPEGRDRSEERGYDRSEDLSYNRDRGYNGGDYRSGGVDYGRGDQRDRFGGGRGYRNDRDTRGGDDDRGFFDRAGDEVRSWFGDEEAERRRRQDEARDQRDYERDYRREERGRAAYGRETSGRDVGYSRYGQAGYGSAGIPDAGNGWSFRDDNRGDQAGQAGHGRHDHDPHYREWRDRQVEALDRDYDDYRRERQTGFENDFGGWRAKRETQRGALRQAKEHQEVVGSDGAHVGTVDHVRGDRILLTKIDQDAGGHHHSIPSSWITSVDDKVTISKTAEEAKKHWKDEETNSAFGQGQGQNRAGADTGAHNLNRSFSGTY